ncbi:MAG: PhnD/SsuA/transferrin family substrate-binding protein, partial [Azovibrio sp.]|nr:PhnD/SsuA/transferrin family substrate-binding protein [Azovibrio sp.]
MGTALAVEAATVRIGVLAFRSLEQTEARWQETARALEAAVPGRRFQIVAMHNDALDAAVAEGSVDFVLTQPEHYIILRNQHGLTALATLMPLAGGKPVVQLGGVIFGRAQDGLRDLHDVAGKRVAAIYPNSLGGFRIQQWELLKAGINLPTDVARLEFVGQPQDNVVEAVLQGRADVGFVRTGVLEAMAAEGRLNLEQVQVINPQSPRVFPQLLSTQLYPEWPFLVRRGVPEELSKAVTLALLNISPDSAAARSGEYYGFSPPGDYTPLEAVLLRLRAHPGRLEHFGLADIVDKYALPLVVGLSLLLCAALAGAWLLFQDRRRINAALHRLEQAEAAQRIAAVAFETQEGIVITDASNRILRVNQAFTQVTGYSAAEAEGQTPALLKSGRHDALFYQHMWSDLQNYGRWQGEIWNRRKNGEIYPEWLTVTAVRDPAGQICHYVAIFTDVTERKAVEAQLEYMTLYDSLTGLANRRLFRDRLQQALYTCIRSRQYGGLLFVDLDDFRYINDTLGHSRGDDVLVEVARRLVEVVGEAATVARLGGDDFTVLAGSLGTDLAEAAARLEQLGEALLQALGASYHLAGGE